MSEYGSWGMFPVVKQNVIRPVDRFHVDLPEYSKTGSLLPYGLGRSYGDVCLNDGGAIVTSEHLDKFIAFDVTTGVVRCEAGVSLSELISVCLPRGYFLPVSPGTRFVTVGGAIANDVHGKNHHKSGTFGCFVNRFCLKRSDGSEIECSPTENKELFAATIGGMGLTGFILWAEIKLRPVTNEFIDVESVQFGNLDEFYSISAESNDFEYTVAWLDCVSGGSQFGRGIFIRGNHNTTRPGGRCSPGGIPLLVPFSLPSFVLNKYSVRAFNEVYYRKQREKTSRAVSHYQPFFYPLDSVHHWNRIYGKRGFVQFQCVIPHGAQREVITEIVSCVVKEGSASFLAVLKEFGEIKSPGIMSFPLPGATLCMDFPYGGGATRWLMQTLEEMVVKAGGRLYPAKDACMTAEHFQIFYPRWKEFASHIDPGFSSSFWRRVSGDIA